MQLARPIQGDSSGTVRLVAGFVLVGAASVLLIAAVLRPDPSGMGTHQQLFRGPCSMLIHTGLPCPTCGMTTAFAHGVRGQLLRAAKAQPTGLLLCLGTFALALAAGYALLLGRWPAKGLHRISPRYFFMSLLLLLVGGWAAKIAMGLADGSLPYR